MNFNFLTISNFSLFKNPFYSEYSGIFNRMNSTVNSFLEANPIWNSGIFSAGSFSNTNNFNTSIFNQNYFGTFTSQYPTQTLRQNFMTTSKKNNNSSIDMSSRALNSISNMTNIVKKDSVNLDNIYNKNLSQNLAKVAQQTAKNLNSKNWCAKGVNDTLEAAGLVKKNSTRMSSAYQLTSKYDKCENLKKVNVSRSELKNLPAGCIIVWQGRGVKDGSFGQHGHVCITLGNGKEASDNIRDLKIYDTDYTVYVPVKNS